MTICIALLISAALSAQTPNQALDNFLGNIAAHRCIFDYDMTSSHGGTSVRSDGKVILQDGCWTATGMGVSIYCDGKSTWILDTKSEELVIEEAQTVDGMMNPVTMLNAFDSSFNRKSVTSDGKRGVKAVLEPKSATNMVSVTVWIAADGSSMSRLIAQMKDGTVSNITIPSFAFKGKALDMSVFSYDEISVPKSYTVTDLR